MEMSGIPFGTTDWSSVEPTEHPGERGKAIWRTREFGGIRVRMVEYTPGYLADHWCQKGHILFCVDGELGTDLAGATERLEHVARLLPEICTLDFGSMNFAAGGDYLLVNTPGMLRAMARRVLELGVRPELEVFDTGHLVLVKELIAEGLIEEPALIQLCTGIPYGAPDDPATLLAMVNQLPPGAVFSTFSIGRMQLPYVAMAALVGGNVRVGLEDNLYLSRGRLASNGDLVERAVRILEAMNARVLGPAEVREKLRLRSPA